MLLLDVIGVVLGLWYLYLEIRERMFMWVIGAIMPLIYIIILYQKGIYGDAIMEVYYFLAAVYGLLYWRFGGVRGRRVVVITYLRWCYHPLFTAVIGVLWGVIYVLLRRYTDSSVPLIDAFTTATSIVALWLLSRKYVEQWWLWFVVDILSAALYIYKGVYGRAFLYALYAVLAVVGYRLWCRRAMAAAAQT